MLIPQYVPVGLIELAYYEYQPEAGKTIFFIHGNSLSSRVWLKQLSSNLFRNYRMVAIDLPAHGNSMASDKPAADYSLPGLGKLMADAIHRLTDNKPFVIFGLSLGTNIAAEMLPHLEAPAGLILAGPSIAGPQFPLSVIVKKGADTTAIFADEVTTDVVKKYGMETSLSREPKDIQVFMEDHALVKPPFRSTLFASIMAGDFSDQVSEIQKLDIPVLIVFGKDELIINTDYLDKAGLNTWQKTIFKIDGASHLVNIDQADAFNELAAKYLEDIFK